jgi:hypothetical protein
MSDTVSLKNIAGRAQNELAIPPSPFPTRGLDFVAFHFEKAEESHSLWTIIHRRNLQGSS